MIQTTRTAAFIAMAAYTLLSGCSATSTQESTGQYIDDVAITAKIKTAIFNAPLLKSTEINVETLKGQVQLSGFVSSQASVDQAVVLARGVAGVTSVQNDMRLK